MKEDGAPISIVAPDYSDKLQQQQEVITTLNQKISEMEEYALIIEEQASEICNLKEHVESLKEFQQAQEFNNKMVEE